MSQVRLVANAEPHDTAFGPPHNDDRHHQQEPYRPTEQTLSVFGVWAAGFVDVRLIGKVAQCRS